MISRPVVLAAALLVALTLGGCGQPPVYTVHPFTDSTPTALPSSPTPDPAADAQVAHAVELGPNELQPFTTVQGSAGDTEQRPALPWTMVDDKSVNPATLEPGCQPRRTPQTADWTRSFIYGETSTGGGHGFANISVMVYTDEHGAVVDQANVMTKSYLDCVGQQDIADGVTSDGGTDVGPIHRTDTSVPATGATSFAEVYYFQYSLNGRRQLYFAHVVWLQYKRLRVFYDKETCCAEPLAADFDPDVTLLTKRLIAAVS